MLKYINPVVIGLWATNTNIVPKDNAKFPLIVPGLSDETFKFCTSLNSKCKIIEKLYASIEIENC